MNIYFVRHGETDYNAKFLLQGSSDIPLNKNGIEVAKKEGEKVREAGLTFDKIYTSQLSRSIDTAMLINNSDDSSFIKDERLAEIGWGPYEGAPYLPMRDILGPYFQDYEGATIEGAEPMRDVAKRVKAAFEDIMRDAKEDENILICAHAVSLRALLHVLSEGKEEVFDKIPLPNAKIYCMECHDGVLKMPYMVFPDKGE